MFLFPLVFFVLLIFCLHTVHRACFVCLNCEALSKTYHLHKVCCNISNNLPIFPSLLQNVPTCCWPTMHQWRWRMLRDGAPLLRPSATETDRWVSVWTVWLALLCNTPKHTFETPPVPLLAEMLFTEISVASVGFQSVAFPCENSDGAEKSSDQQMQINSCLCTFFHAAASKWGRDAGLPPLSVGERGHSSRPSGFCAQWKAIHQMFLSLLIGWLWSSPCLAHFLPTVHSGSSFDLKRFKYFFF